MRSPLSTVSDVKAVSMQTTNPRALTVAARFLTHLQTSFVVDSFWHNPIILKPQCHISCT